MGKCCVAGCGEIVIDYKQKLFKIGDVQVKDGEWLSLDGSTGEIFVGQLPLVEPKLEGDFYQLMKWANKVSKMQVRTNADTPADAQKAREFGAVGIGLCRTEHMFFDPKRIKSDAQNDFGGKHSCQRTCFGGTFAISERRFFMAF